jgi:hypothetical protein
MYDGLISISIINLLFIGGFAIVFTYFVITKLVIYKLKRIFALELDILKQVLPQATKNNIKQHFETKKQNQIKYIKYNFIFISGPVVFLILILLIRYLNNPHKTLVNLSHIFTIKNIPNITIMLLISMILQGIVVLSITSVYTVDYIAIIIRQHINEYVSNSLDKL